MQNDDQQNPGTSEGQFRPGEGSSGPGGKHRASYERYGNYGMIKTDLEPDRDPLKPLDSTVRDATKVVEDKEPK